MFISVHTSTFIVKNKRKKLLCLLYSEHDHHVIIIVIIIIVIMVSVHSFFLYIYFNLVFIDQMEGSLLPACPSLMCFFLGFFDKVISD